MENKIPVYLLNIEKMKSIDDERFRIYFPKRYERAQRYRFEDDKLRCLAVAYLLKEVLGLDEEKIMLSENDKPYVAGGPEFNLSHSGNYAVLAVSDGMVGVDVEMIDSRNTGVADRVFTAEELDWMSGQPEERFWTLWTLKEAASKAVGMGLNLEYNSFSVLPLIRGDSLQLEGEVLYGRSEFLDEHCLSVVSTMNTEMLINEL